MRTTVTPETRTEIDAPTITLHPMGLFPRPVDLIPEFGNNSLFD